jgi:hypothetical protein
VERSVVSRIIEQGRPFAMLYPVSLLTRQGNKLRHVSQMQRLNQDKETCFLKCFSRSNSNL